MLSPQDALLVVMRERQFQDATYEPTQVLESSLTRAQRDLDVTSHLTLLDSYIRQAQDKWSFSRKNTGTSSSTAALQDIAKIAAIALRALERAGGSEKLLEVGLR